MTKKEDPFGGSVLGGDTNKRVRGQLARYGLCYSAHTHSHLGSPKTRHVAMYLGNSSRPWARSWSRKGSLSRDGRSSAEGWAQVHLYPRPF